MRNHDIAELLEEIADILEIKGIAWKPIAYRKAARYIESLSEDIEKIYKKDGIDGIKGLPGVGEGIAKKIVEYLETGRIKKLEELKRTMPESVVNMMDIPGLGPKKVSKLYQELKIHSLQELKKAAKAGNIQKLQGFGKKSEEDILTGLELIKKGHERMLLSNVRPIANAIVNELSSLKEISRIDIAGSIRRMKETVKDIDILVVSEKPSKIMDYFVKLKDVKKIIAKGMTKSSVILKEGINCDLRIVEEKSYGGALAYFTGSKDHNIRMRQIALKNSMKLSEYGLFNRKNKYLCGKNEKEIYAKLKLPYIEPEMRENTGELELKKAPELIKYSEIKGDLHLHTSWSDGVNTTEEMIKEAIALGYEYIAITDHSKSAYAANGLDEKRFKKHLEEIDLLNKKYKNKINILKGAELEILKDGSLDYSPNLLKQLDIVIASMHSGFKASKEDNTKRMIKAIKSNYVNVIAHPTGRIINQRNPYEINLDLIIDEAKSNNVLLEINSYPSRLDLKDTNIRLCVGRNANMVIITDSHAVNHMSFMELGISQARRGWAEKKNIVNTMKFEKFMKYLSK